ncbi:hypothetical protein Tco_0652138 [Tanacetum coccineum]|uniref:Uncharacterized protein n=1 Tax=Tanacetum coccineum TaxID=301880 RepID=A0ABQ4WWR9_9ASTR
MQTTCQEKQIQELTELVKQLARDNTKLKEELNSMKSEKDKPDGKEKCSDNFDDKEKCPVKLAKLELSYAGSSSNPRGRGRGLRGGRGRNQFTTKTIFQKELAFEQSDFPALFNQSYKEKVMSSEKKDFSYPIKQYIKNFAKIANFLNKVPSKMENDLGYVTCPHDKINQLVALVDCNSEIVKSAYDYGLLHSVYTKNGAEVSKIPKLFEVAKTFLKITKANMVYIRIYGAIAEVDYEKIYPTVRIAKIGITNHYIIPETKIQEEVIIEELPSYFTKKRSWSFKVMADAILDITNTPFRVNHYEKNTVIVTNATTRDEQGLKILESIYWKIYSPIDALKNNMQAKVLPEKMLSESGMKQLCKILYQDTNHKCEFCGKEEVNNYVPAVILEELFEDKRESVMHDEYE